MPAVLERGEFVINRRAVARPGMLRRLQQINTGAQGGATPVVHQVHNHTTITINAIDAANMEAAVNDRIIPLLEDAQRRGAYAPLPQRS